MVKLTVVHDGFAPGSAVLEGVRGGWPAVLASLKTLLETGDRRCRRPRFGRKGRRERHGRVPSKTEVNPLAVPRSRSRILSMLLRNERS